MTIRTSFAPITDAEVTRVFASAFGHQCFVCRRQPWPVGLTYKNLSLCAPCAPLARQRELMNDTTQAEDAAGMSAIDRAGEYLASIDKFDLRDLSDAELQKFNAHFIAGFGDAMREQVSGQPPF